MALRVTPEGFPGEHFEVGALCYGSDTSLPIYEILSGVRLQTETINRARIVTVIRETGQDNHIFLCLQTWVS